uniref:Uncharacterized protein n=1 Tax=Arundo donax TaxID=35708 RepID=A0A0A9B505_ARUDO
MLLNTELEDTRYSQNQHQDPGRENV